MQINIKDKKMEKQPRRIRLNQELRNKITPRFRVHLEAEDTSSVKFIFYERTNYATTQKNKIKSGIKK